LARFSKNKMIHKQTWKHKKGENAGDFTWRLLKTMFQWLFTRFLVLGLLFRQQQYG